MCNESDYDRVIRPIEGQMILSIWRILRHSDDADDALQDALERIWKQRKHVFTHPNPRALVLRICNQAAYDLLRKRMRHDHETYLTDQLTVIADSSLAPGEQALQQEQRQKILDDISCLPRNQAIAVLMRLVDQVSYEEIAGAIGCSQATARTHVKRGRQRLQAQLTRRDDSEKEQGDEP